jgi:nitrogen fixation NifU-like protein
MDLKDLYREVILDHNKSPRQFGRLDPADSSADGHNPLCGDRLHLTLRLDGDRVTDLRFDGKGCAISVASASMMCEAVKGKSRPEISHLLSGVREFPVRVKCASLAWHTLNAALERSPVPVQTE